MHRSAHLAARALAAAGASLLLLAAPAAAHETQNVDIEFAARAGDAPVACGSPIPGLGSDCPDRAAHRSALLRLRRRARPSEAAPSR